MANIKAYRDDLPIFGVRSTLCVDMPDTPYPRGAGWMDAYGSSSPTITHPLEMVLHDRARCADLLRRGMQIEVEPDDMESAVMMARACGTESILISTVRG